MISDYSSYSVDELETVLKYLYAAYRTLYCPSGAVCKDCCIFDDCKALARVKAHIYLEIFERKAVRVEHGEEKDRP